jgi:hypothetical protein
MKLNFKIRASACGLIMTNDRSGKGMGKTVYSYLDTWMKEQIYNRKKIIESKYFDKGSGVEIKSINYISEQLGLGMVFKNEEYFENDYMTGCPDLVLPDEVIEVKNSFDCFTFPLFEFEPPDKNNEWQVLVYMALTGRKKARIIYSLMDTPFDIVERQMNWNEESDHERIVKYHEYSHLDAKLRIKSFDVTYDPVKIDAIKDRVSQCRKYIDETMQSISI